MNFIEKKFINLISNRLLNFKWNSSNNASCRCPLCGDSKKSRKKSRGSFFDFKGTTFYGCYNCGQHKSFNDFLYKFDQDLWKEFKLESFKDKISSEKIYQTNYFEPQIKIPFEIPKINKEKNDSGIFSDIKKISKLNINHPAKKYVHKRKIDFFANELYYVSDFPKWISEKFIKHKKWESFPKHPRLIFPCYDVENNLIGFTARALLENSLRYCHVKFNEEHDFLFGLERIDTSKRVKIVEGNIDSLMLDNAIAVMGSNLNSVNIFNDYVVIYDNQPRNKEIITLLQKTIEDNKNVVIWPEGFEYKDLNDAVVKGNFDKQSLEKLIAENTFCGIMALIKFKQWKKL